MAFATGRRIAAAAGEVQQGRDVFGAKRGEDGACVCVCVCVVGRVRTPFMAAKAPTRLVMGTESTRAAQQLNVHLHSHFRTPTPIYTLPHSHPTYTVPWRGVCVTDTGVFFFHVAEEVVVRVVRQLAVQLGLRRTAGARSAHGQLMVSIRSAHGPLTASTRAQPLAVQRGGRQVRCVARPIQPRVWRPVGQRKPGQPGRQPRRWMGPGPSAGVARARAADGSAKEPHRGQHMYHATSFGAGPG